MRTLKRRIPSLGGVFALPAALADGDAAAEGAAGAGGIGEEARVAYERAATAASATPAADAIGIQRRRVGVVALAVVAPRFASSSEARFGCVVTSAGSFARAAGAEPGLPGAGPPRESVE